MILKFVITDFLKPIVLEKTIKRILVVKVYVLNFVVLRWMFLLILKDEPKRILSEYCKNVFL